MECEVAREALSARLDGEREPVPSVRVDEHLHSCSTCTDWYFRARSTTERLRTLTGQSRPAMSVVTPPADPAPRPRARRLQRFWRPALGLAGAVQLAVALLQGFGVDVGFAHLDPAGGHGHLLNESTAWSVALGLVMLAAAAFPVLAAGLCAVLTGFAAVLAGYVVVDAVAGAVTPLRVLSHLPVLAGAVLAALVWRTRPAPPPRPDDDERDAPITLPEHAVRGRRRGHLRRADDSVA